MMKDDYKRIHWRAGQEITPDSFTQADNYATAQLNVIRRLINLQFYGLLPAGDGDAPSLTVDASINGTEITINQMCCIGITKNGYLVDFKKNQICAIETNRLMIPKNAARFCYVVLRVKPFELFLVEPVENEETPFALPVYELDIKELQQIAGNELPILKIDCSQHQPAIDRSYVPPCMSLQSFDRLWEYYLELKQLMTDIASIVKDKKARDANYQKLNDPTALLLFDLEQFSPNNPPYYLIQLLKKIIKTIEVYVNQSQWNLKEVLNTPYDHNDITIIIQSITKCFKDIKLYMGKVEAPKAEDFTPRI